MRIWPCFIHQAEHAFESLLSVARICSAVVAAISRLVAFEGPFCSISDVARGPSTEHLLQLCSHKTI